MESCCVRELEESDIFHAESYASGPHQWRLHAFGSNCRIPEPGRYRDQKTPQWPTQISQGFAWNVQYNCSIIRRIRRSWWHFPEEHHVLQILSVLGLTSLISLKGCDENATSNPSQMLVIFTLIFGFACLVFLRWFANMPHAPAAQEEPHDEAVVMNDNPGADTVQWLL